MNFWAVATIASGGVFTGLVAGNLITRKILKKKYEEDLEKTRRYYRDKEKTVEKEPEEKFYVRNESPAEEDKKIYKRVSEEYSKRSEEEEMTSTTNSDYIEYDNSPYVITSEEYNQAMIAGETVCDLYWSGGANLRDSDGNEIDIPSTIGQYAIDYLAQKGRDEPAVYVHNPAVNIYYEVNWDFLTPNNTGSSHRNQW